MAAIALPLIASLAPGLIQLITSLVHPAAQEAESALGAGTGPVKKGQVFDTVKNLLMQAANTGTIPKALPSDEIIMIIIEAVVSSMNLSGLLGSSTMPKPNAPLTSTVPQGGILPNSSTVPQSITLRAGQNTITVTVIG